MAKFNSFRYYGYFTHDDGESVFHVLIIQPPCSTYSQWIGQRYRKVTDLLVLDDFILSSIPNLIVDWTGAQQ